MVTGMFRLLRVALSSRKLFKNWFSAGLKYFLIVKVLKKQASFTVKCQDGSILRLSHRLFGSLIYGFSNHMIQRISCKEEKAWINDFPISLSEFEVASVYAVNLAIRWGWKYDEKEKCWVKDSIKLRHATVTEALLYEEYRVLDVNGKDVIDIGSYVGDSAIYFALRGAKRIIAVEPHPRAFNEMIENIKLNNLKNVIIPINAGLASKPGKICVEDSVIEATIGAYHKPGECGSSVPAITLSDIVKKFNIGNNAVLKMDCEGCEYDIILNDYESIKLFNEILFEHHSYKTGIPVEVLLKILSRDFECRDVTMTSKYLKRQKGMGLIKCIKKH